MTICNWHITQPCRYKGALQSTNSGVCIAEQIGITLTFTNRYYTYFYYILQFTHCSHNAHYTSVTAVVMSYSYTLQFTHYARDTLLVNLSSVFSAGSARQIIPLILRLYGRSEVLLFP